MPRECPYNMFRYCIWCELRLNPLFFKFLKWFRSRRECSLYVPEEWDLCGVIWDNHWNLSTWYLRREQRNERRAELDRILGGALDFLMGRSLGALAPDQEGKHGNFKLYISNFTGNYMLTGCIMSEEDNLKIQQLRGSACWSMSARSSSRSVRTKRSSGPTC